MAILDKLGGFAKSVSDKTNDMLEIGRLNSRIHGEEDAIEQHMLDLGEYIWGKFQTGVAMDERTTVICMAIRERQNNIKSMQAEIETIKKNQEEIRAQARQAKAAAPEPETEICPVCGGVIAAGSKFCGDCGTQLR